jgi:hypothetical protein
MTTGISSYVTPAPVDTDASDTILETTIVTSLQTVDIGGGVMANAEVYNGTIPGPPLRLNVGDTLIVRLVNNLPHPSGIHWHGIEMGNSADGTPFTQNPVPAGGTYLYGGSPTAPGALAAGAQLLPVRRGQDIRLQIVNCATTRYFRLILTLEDGTPVDLVRVGGECGLLDNAVVEGGVGPGFNFKYTASEILIPPASRADVVAAIPLSAAGVLTMWTQDFERTGAGFARIPTVPVMHLHLEVTGAPAESYVIANGTRLRAAIPGASVEVLPAPTGVLLNPATFTPAKPGMSSQTIQITAMGGDLGIDMVHGHHPDHDPYTDSPHLDSSRQRRRTGSSNSP